MFVVSKNKHLDIHSTLYSILDIHCTSIDFFDTIEKNVNGNQKTDKGEYLIQYALNYFENKHQGLKKPSASYLYPKMPSIDKEELILRLINQTEKPIFLTGRAGTGKTTLLHKITEQTHKNLVVVAPTAVAAINAGGMTIHSMFQIPFHSYLPTDHTDNNGSMHFETRNSIRKHFRINKKKRKIIRNLELLVIDEVSMVRPDLLDVVDEALRYYRMDSRPFGGVQLLFIGDLLQLPPIIRQDEWQVLSQYYDSKYFFDAHALKKQKPIYIELQKIYRQSDKEFIEVLQKLRENKVDQQVLDLLEDRIAPDFKTEKNPGFIVLTTHNKKSDEINEKSLNELNTKSHTFTAEIVGDFPEKSYPLPPRLVLKKGAQVMFVKNDPSPDKKYYNGKIGKISGIDGDEISVVFEDENMEITVDKHSWENVHYQTDSKNQEIKEEVLGTYTQYPLRLAWAITIHKSQGLTFQKAAIDISEVFAPGQAYVALSRLTSLQGLRLLAPIGNRKLHAEEALLQFTRGQKPVSEVENDFDRYTIQYLLEIGMTTFEYSDVQLWIRAMLKEMRDAPAQSIIRKEEKWLSDLIAQMEDIVSVASKFVTQLKRMKTTLDTEREYKHERLDSSSKYFDERWWSVMKLLLERQMRLAVVSRVTGYRSQIAELSELVYLNLKRIHKLKIANKAISNGEKLQKGFFTTQKLDDQIRQWNSELREKSGISKLVEDIDPKFNDEPQKKKLNTAEITFQLWLSMGDVKQIAETRKLQPSTIMNHLITAVREGKIAVDELIDESEMLTIKEKVGDREFETMSQMKKALNDDFDYDALRLFRLWDEKNTAK